MPNSYYSHRLERFVFSLDTKGYFSKAFNELILTHNISCIRSSINRSSYAEHFWAKLQAHPGLTKFKAVFKYGDEGIRSSEVSDFSIGEVKIIERSTIWGLARTVDDFRKTINTSVFDVEEEEDFV